MLLCCILRGDQALEGLKVVQDVVREVLLGQGPLVNSVSRPIY